MESEHLNGQKVTAQQPKRSRMLSEKAGQTQKPSTVKDQVFTLTATMERSVFQY